MYETLGSSTDTKRKKGGVWRVEGGNLNTEATAYIFRKETDKLKKNESLQEIEFRMKPGTNFFSETFRRHLSYSGLHLGLLHMRTLILYSCSSLQLMMHCH